MLNKQKRHRSYPDLTIEDVLLAHIEELPFDGISVCGIWADAINGFGLSDAEAEEFSRLAFATLFEAGATLARPSEVEPFFQHIDGYEGPVGQVTDRIIRELREMGGLPDFTWLWFFRFDGS